MGAFRPGWDAEVKRATGGLRLVANPDFTLALYPDPKNLRLVHPDPKICFFWSTVARHFPVGVHHV